MPDPLARQFLDQMIQEKLVSGIDDRGNVSFPLTQGEFRELVERKMDDRRMRELMREAPGGGLIDVMRQRGLMPPGV